MAAARSCSLVLQIAGSGAYEKTLKEITELQEFYKRTKTIRETIQVKSSTAEKVEETQVDYGKQEELE